MVKQNMKRILKVIKVLRKHQNADLENLGDKAKIAEDVIDELHDEFKQDRGL